MQLLPALVQEFRPLFLVSLREAPETSPEGSNALETFMEHGHDTVPRHVLSDESVRTTRPDHDP